MKIILLTLLTCFVASPVANPGIISAAEEKASASFLARQVQSRDALLPNLFTDFHAHSSPATSVAKKNQVKLEEDLKESLELLWSHLPKDERESMIKILQNLPSGQSTIKAIRFRNKPRSLVEAESYNPHKMICVENLPLNKTIRYILLSFCFFKLSHLFRRLDSIRVASIIYP